jgi:hypothetical protein
MSCHFESLSIISGCGSEDVCDILAKLGHKEVIASG